MSKFLRFSFASLVLVAMCALSAMAQSTTTGAINGTVMNPNKEVVAGAAVTVKNNGTNKEATATTDGNGGFKVGNLAPGVYTVNANGSGFAPYINPNVVVEVGLATTLDVGLSLQGVTGTVEVTAEAPVINTTQQDFSSNMNQTSINELPVNGSRWSNFALLTPGTVPDANFGLISFRGISGLLNNNTVDGGDNNQAFFSEERGRTRINYVVSQSAIKEFQVNTSNYSAEYGRAAGGVTNAVTKSGTNGFHGDAFFYDRDNKLGARNPLAFQTTFDPTTGARTVLGIKPVDKRYRFGGDIGGPIKKDKAFFFFNYDELRRNFPGLAIFSSPSYPTTVNNALLLGKGLTQAQINSVLSFLNSETGPTPRAGNQRIFMPKVDWNINSKNTFTVTYNRLRWQSPSGIQTQPTNTFGVTSFGDDFVSDDSVNIRLASNFGANLINEARYQWSRDFEFENSKTPLAGEPLTAPAYPGTIAAGTRGPDVFLSSGIEFGVATFLERPKYPDERRNQFFDMVTITKGSHTFKVGGDFNHVSEVADNLRFYAGSYSYNNINDFIIDYTNWQTPLGAVVCSTSSRIAGRCYTSPYAQAFGGTVYSLKTNDYNFFGQDDWRVNQRLTLSLGLRWEYQQFPKPFIANPAIPQTAVMPSDKNNFGPRIGFAWDMKGDGKNSLRGGYGIYFGRMGSSTIYNALVNTAMPGGQFSVSLSQTNALAPVFPNTLATQPSNPTVGVQFFQAGFQLPTIHQADLVFEHEISRNTVISGSLLLSFGKNLPTFVDTNLNPPTRSFSYTVSGGPFDGQVLTVPWFYGTSRPNPNFGAMTEIRSIVWSKYVGGVVQLNRRLTKGLQFQINYTRSMARDAGQTSTTFTATNTPYNAFDPIVGEEGRSNFDIPNKLIADAVWQPESKNKFLKDWTFSPIFAAYSGAPLSTFVSASVPSPGIVQDPICWTGSGTSNLCSTPGGGVNGSGGNARFALAPRNGYRMPRIWNLDLRVSRRFRFKESQALELLIEGFNVFNRTQVTGMNNGFYNGSSVSATCNATRTVCTSPTATLTYNTSFQTVSAAGGTLFRERQIQWAVRYSF
jgi:Carboxypeptidase regulatory-like domain/TonB dependent receptor